MKAQRRLRNDEEFESFAEEGCNEKWMSILEIVLVESIMVTTVSLPQFICKSIFQIR